MVDDLQAASLPPLFGSHIHGRRQEWSALRALLDDAQRGHGALALVGGEAGIGKTTLVSALLSEAAARSLPVLTGTSYQSEVSAAYAVWKKVFQSARRWPQIPAPPAPFVEQAAMEAVSGAAELWGMVSDWLDHATAEQPVVIALEDLHWADQASVDLLRYLARQTLTTAALIVATYRDAELTAADPLYQRLPQLAREGRAARLALRPLDREATRSLLLARYPTLDPTDIERLAAYLSQYGGGNPLFIEELLAMLEHERALSSDGSRWTLDSLPAFAVPPLVRQMIDERLQRLSDRARTLLQIAAVIGVEFSFDLWHAVSAAADDDLSSALEEAVQERILVQVPNSDTLRFHHALVHSVVYESLNLMRRMRLHRAVGETVAAQPGADPGAVAHHFIQANDPRAADWLIEAARLATRASALHAMVANYQRALAMLEHNPSRQADCAWLLCALAEAHRYTDVAQALACVSRAVEMAERLDDPAIAVLARWCQARMRSFDDQNALDELMAAAAAFAELEPAQQERIISSPLNYVVSAGTLSQDLANCGRLVEAKQRAEEFLARHPAPLSRAQYIEFGNAHFGLGIACATLGEPIAARAAFERARWHFREISNFQMVSNACYWELNTLSQVYDADQPEWRRRLQEEEVRANARSQFVSAPDGGRRFSTSDTLILDSDWDDCWSSASARLAVPASRIPSARKLADIEWLRGNLPRAKSHIASALPAGPDEAPGRRFFLHRHELQRVAAEIALDEGDDALAERWIAALDRWLDWSGKVSGRSVPRLLAARLAEQRGDLRLAFQQATQALDLAANPRQPLEEARARRTLARLCARAGKRDEAERHARQALEITEACDAPYEVALSRVVLAEVAPSSRDIPQALATAREIAERLSARPLLERIAALDTSPPAAVAVPGGLSPREREVLELAAQGMTDSQIADALSISSRTVSGHLQSIYNKLGVNTRTAAVAYAFAHGLVRN